MRQIISIGGGSFANPTSELKIEKYILSQVEKENPKICFLPQASNEDQGYVVKFFETFIRLGAQPSWLSLFGNVEDGWQQHLLEQDVIYVGGGNTKSMLSLWKTWQLDKVVSQAYKQGIVLAGVSAGAICWFEQGLTDSVYPLGVISGLGLIKGSCCPHYDSELDRKPIYISEIDSFEITKGIALEDDTAAHYVDDNLKCVVSAKEGKLAYKVAMDSHEKIIPELL